MATCQREETMCAVWETSCWTGLEPARNASSYPLSCVMSRLHPSEMGVLWIGSGMLWYESCRFSCPRFANINCYDIEEKLEEELRGGQPGYPVGDETACWENRLDGDGTSSKTLLEP